MRAVHKFPLGRVTSQSVSMPLGAYIIAAQFQRGQLCLWAIVDTDAPINERKIEIAGTGHTLLDVFPFTRKHLATVQEREFVWHVFEIVHGIEA